MATAVHEELPQGHMCLPLPTGKVAIWLFLVTEIMFFTALIGTYIILRHGTPANSIFKWPAPHQVHLNEAIGAINTFGDNYFAANGPNTGSLTPVSKQ